MVSLSDNVKVVVLDEHPLMNVRVHTVMWCPVNLINTLVDPNRGLLSFSSNLENILLEAKLSDEPFAWFVSSISLLLKTILTTPSSDLKTPEFMGVLKAIYGQLLARLKNKIKEGGLI